MKITCRHCGLTQEVSLHKTYVHNGFNNHHYIDQFGRVQYKTCCADCRAQMIRKRRDTKPRSASDDARIQVAIASEMAVVNFLNAKGRWARLGHGAGPDVWLLPKREGGKPRSIEVKRIVAKNPRNYRTREVRPARMKDDFIAFVFENKVFKIERMKTHLKRCSPSGQRTFTKYFAAKDV